MILAIRLSSLAEPLKDYLRLDRYLIGILVLFSMAIIPTIPRATDNAMQLANFSSDGPALTLCLYGMTKQPYGNPGNYDGHNHHVRGDFPPDYSILRYGNFFYYGGTYLDLGFILFWPLRKILGVPIYPWAPIILASISFLASLLSLALIYNVAKKQAGALAGVIAALLLVTNTFFIGYTTIIHPDSMQLFLTLVVVILAARHADMGNWSSLALMGLMAGIHQGTKCGGGWMLPALLLATFWGWRSVEMAVDLKSCARLAARGGTLGLLILLGFFCSTPYAFLDGFYFQALDYAKSIVTKDQLNNHLTAVDWFYALWEHLGPVFGSLYLVAVCRIFVLSVYGKANRLLLLSLTVAFGNIIWYSLQGRVWVLVGYFLPAMGLLTIVLAVMLTDTYRYLYSRPLTKYLAPLGLAALMLCLFFTHGQRAAAKMLSLYFWKSTTTLQANSSLGRLVPPHSKILMELHAYFDPEIYPDQLPGRGALTYEMLRTQKPDYIVLMSRWYDWHVIRKGRQAYKDGGAESNMLAYPDLRLYRDLLDRRRDPLELGPTNVPGIELVAVVPGLESDMQPSLGVVEGGTLANLVRASLGLEHEGLGPTLLLYRINPEAIPVD